MLSLCVCVCVCSCVRVCMYGCAFLCCLCVNEYVWLKFVCETAHTCTCCTYALCVCVHMGVDSIM